MKKPLTQNQRISVVKAFAVRTAILLLLIGSVHSISVAQQLSSGSAQDPAKVVVPAKYTTVKMATAATVTKIVALSETPADQPPYYNYKGITDPEQAKAAWVNDNPEAYNNLLRPATSHSIPVVESPQTNYVVLPSAYDGTPMIIDQKTPAGQQKLPVKK